VSDPICPDCGFAITNGLQSHTPDTCIVNLNRTIKALSANAKQDTELFEKILGGALKESCVYRNNNLVDWTFHCCDWSEVAEEIAKRLGINLEENERGGSET